jgi:hypothetical protein
MPSWVVDLCACWWTGVALRVWKMAPSCLLWCLLRERNDQNFEDRERTLEELKSFLYSLYSLTTVFLASLMINFNDFLVLFSSSK